MRSKELLDGSSTMIDTDTNAHRLQVSTKSLLLTAAGFVFVVSVAVLIDEPALVPGIAIPCAAWYVWRIYRPSSLGTVLGVIALELVTAIASLIYHSKGNVFVFIPAAILSLAALGSMLASVGTYLVQAYRSDRQRRENVSAAVAACLLPIVWFLVGPRGAGLLSDRALRQEIAGSELPGFIADLNALAERSGSAPKNEKELAQMLGRPLSRLSRGPVRYHCREGRHYTLGFGFDLDCYEFDSESPDKRWHRPD